MRTFHILAVALVAKAYAALLAALFVKTALIARFI